jgi:hypothetical protein
MELVINKQFGGFNLSPLAIQEFLKRKGKQVFFYHQTKYKFRDGVEEYTKVSPTDADWMDFSLLVDLGDTITDLENAEWFDDKDIERHDSILVDVVKEMGDLANTQVSTLRVVEIPDGITYEISNYDGMESVEESHRSWG